MDESALYRNQIDLKYRIILLVTIVLINGVCSFFIMPHNFFYRKSDIISNVNDGTDYGRIIWAGFGSICYY